MSVGVDVLGDQEAQLVDVSVRSGELFPEAGLVHAGCIVGQEAFFNIFIQRHQEMPFHTVFFHVQGTPENHIRHFALGKRQAYGAAPFGILDLVEIHMDAGLLFNLPEIPHAAEIHGDVFNFVLKGRQGYGGGGGTLVPWRRGAACHQEQCRGQQADDFNGTLHRYSLYTAKGHRPRKQILRRCPAAFRCFYSSITSRGVQDSYLAR